MAGSFVWALVGVAILVILVMIWRVISKGSFLATLRGGVPMVDKAGTGKICELIEYEKNESTGKVRLFLNYLGKGITQTGFWFDPDLDFYPSLARVRWEDYMGTIVCYRDFETGRNDFREESSKHLLEEYKALAKYVHTTKKRISDQLKVLDTEGTKTGEEKEVFKHSKALNAIKKLVSSGDEFVTKEDIERLSLTRE
jgi:hypothetical protein